MFCGKICKVENCFVVCNDINMNVVYNCYLYNERIILWMRISILNWFFCKIKLDIVKILDLMYDDF